MDFFGADPAERRERWDGWKTDEEKEKLQLTCQVRVDFSPRNSDSAFCVTGFTKYECAFLCREKGLHRKLNHVSRLAHVVVSASTGLGIQILEPQWTD